MGRPLRASIALLLLLAGCSAGVEAGVNVKSVATDLVYGIPEERIPAAPANIGTPPDEPVQIVHRDTSPDDDQTPITPPAPECAVAPPDKFPEPALSTIKGRPQEGEYMWRTQGTEETALLGKVPLPRFSRRQITSVAATEGNNFQYTLQERDLRYGARTMIKTTYEIRHDDGIYLTKIERETEGGAKSLFEPFPVIEILPLPAELGADISATGVDANTLEALRVTGAVTKRLRVDACGEPVDTFFIDGAQEFISASGEPSRRNYDYGIATALGGQLAFEHVEAPCSNETDKETCDPAGTLIFDAHIGQLKPDEPR